MRKLSKKTQLLGLSALCAALIVFIVYLIVGGKTPVAVDSGAPAPSTAPAPAASTTPANSTAPYAPIPVERVSGPFYYAESAAYFGLPDWFGGWRHAPINNNNQLIVIHDEEETEANPGLMRVNEYLYITDCENAERYGPLPAGYAVYDKTSGDIVESESVGGITFDEYNNMYVLCADENANLSLTVYDEQFNKIKADIPWESKYGRHYYRNIAYYKGYIYALGAGWESGPVLEIYSADGVRVEEMQEYPWVWCMDVTEDGFLYTIYDNARRDKTYIGKYDLNTGEQIYNRVMNENARRDGHNKIAFNPKDGCLYIAGDLAITRYNEEEYIYETMIEYGMETSFFAGGYESGDLRVQEFKCDRDGNLYLLGDTLDDGAIIYKFSMMPGEKPAREETATTILTLTACYKDRFLTEAIKRYELLNPDIKIEYDVMYETEEEFYVNLRDATTIMLTRLLANDMGDIVFITNIMMQALETDVFMDLWDRVRSDASYPDLNLYALNGLLSGGRKMDGQLRGLPIGLTYNYLLYNKALGDELGIAPDFDTFTWGDAIDLALELDLKGRGIYLLGGEAQDSMLYDVVRRNLPDLMDRESKFVNLKQGWFINLLEKLKTVEALGVTRVADIYGGGYSDCLFAEGYLSRSYIETISRASNLENDYMMVPIPAGELNRNTTAHPSYMCSISASSRLQDEAWGFLSYLINHKTQASRYLSAIPVNNKTIGIQTEYMLSSENESGMAAAERLRVIFDRIDVLGDSKYNGYLFSSLTDYVYRSGSLDAALDKAEYDIWLMLNE